MYLFCWLFGLKHPSTKAYWLLGRTSSCGRMEASRRRSAAQWGLKRSISTLPSVLNVSEGKRGERRRCQGRPRRKALRGYVSPQRWERNGAGFGVLLKVDVFVH